jgi:hypothetical protein
MRATSMAIARSLSTLGHPLVVVPVAVATLVLHEPASWQVRRGHWQHIDASAQAERRSLILFLAIVLFLGAAVAWLTTSDSLAHHRPCAFET